MSNQYDLLDYIRGLPDKWFTCKEIHTSYSNEERELNYKCVNRMISKFYDWGLLERKKDRNERHGYMYKLVK